MAGPPICQRGWPSWWAHIIDMDIVSLVCHRHCLHCAVCIRECVCVCSVHLLLKGGPKGLPLQVRNDRDDSRISALSLPLSVPRPSLPLPSVYWQVCGYSTTHTMNLNDPACIRNHYLHGTNVHCEYESSAVGVADHLKHTHTHMLKCECEISPRCTPVLHSSVSLGENREIHAQWSSWIISWAWMSNIGPTCVSIILICWYVKGSGLAQRAVCLWVICVQSPCHLHMQSIIQIT